MKITYDSGTDGNFFSFLAKEFVGFAGVVALHAAGYLIAGVGLYAIAKLVERLTWRSKGLWFTIAYLTIISPMVLMLFGPEWFCLMSYAVFYWAARKFVAHCKSIKWT